MVIEVFVAEHSPVLARHSSEEGMLGPITCDLSGYQAIHKADQCLDIGVPSSGLSYKCFRWALHASPGPGDPVDYKVSNNGLRRIPALGAVVACPKV
jgi:hypothetical protein